MPGYEARIVDDEGGPVPPGEIGNLRVKGDSTMAYYWNKHEKTKDTLFGHVDPDRRQVLPGRRRLLLVLRPRRRHAEGRRHLGLAGRGRGDADRAPAVLEAAVVGQRGHRPAGQAPGLRRPQGRPRGRRAALADELKAFVKDKIAPYKYPRWIEFVAELPKTATGKIQRFKLRQGTAGA